MKMSKNLRRAALIALVLSAIPYRFRKDEESGAVEIRSLLWGWKKTPRAEGETQDHYCLAIPASGLDQGEWKTELPDVKPAP